LLRRFFAWPGNSSSHARACHSRPQDVIQLEYVWQGGMSKTDLRSKTRTWTKATAPTLADLPVWNFDGSSTGQAPGHDSEVLLRPVRLFKDPFRKGPHLIVLCDCLDPRMEPIPSNTRAPADALFKQKLGEEPWFGELKVRLDAGGDRPA
jgi:glutamine synthetase